MKNELLSALTFSAAFAAFGGIVAIPRVPEGGRARLRVRGAEFCARHLCIIQTAE